jgi:hypothetical protein|uniref:Uncharacterized protein n=1 Tax=Marinobacter nauticus TaxID=2743 RepID=A0A455W6N1_MARNT|nr:hypothetical protein YBY_29180 [Marinobacter nauticus]|tara:strand:- start:1020 stop:1160 length:141 start_codon:yes stop_codon:yes gene_type:complete
MLAKWCHPDRQNKQPEAPSLAVARIHLAGRLGFAVDESGIGSELLN